MEVLNSKNPLILKAFEFMYAKHQGQVDKTGAPYYLHPLKVASFVSSEEAAIVALLHDTLEDTDATKEEIAEIFGSEVADRVERVTHKKGDSYMEYVKKAGADPVTREVKLADLRHNMDLTRFSVITEKEIKRVAEKYVPAYNYLMGL